MQSAIALRGLTKQFAGAGHFNGPLAVDSVDLDVREKEFLVMVGPSGCGKSTVLRMVAGLEEPTAGEICMNGRRIDGLPARVRNIGFMFQGSALFRQMTVAQNIDFGLRIKKAPRAERVRRAAELIEMMGLDGLEDRRPGQLSGGQQQRVALARALAPSPDLLLLDEPFGAVDAKARQKLRADTKRWQREVGVPTVLVTHDQREALELGDRVAVMNLGRFEQVDTPQNVYNSPATGFVGRFIGRANVFETNLARGRGGVLNSARFEVMIRPEDISVLPRRNGTTPGKDELSGTVVGHVFLGRTVRLEVRLGGGKVVTVAMPKHEALDHGLTPGTSVGLYVESCQVFLASHDSQDGRAASPAPDASPLGPTAAEGERLHGQDQSPR